MKRLTAAAIRAALAKTRSRRIDLPDGAVPGLALRLGRIRGATWSLLFRVVGEGGVTGRGHALKGEKRRISLGTYPEVSLESARMKANQCLEQARSGERPTDALESRATAGGLTVSALADKFLEDYVQMKELRAVLKYRGAFRVHIVPQIGQVLADVLNRDQVRVLIKSVMVRNPRGKGGRSRPRGGKEAARTTLGVLRKMINWGIRERLLKRTDNPCTGMEENLPKKRARERVLSLEEARLAWQAAGTLGYPFGPVFRLMLLTGCRSGEWSACRRNYVDLQQKLLVIPASAYKSDHVHIVPLISEAVTILEQVFRDQSPSDGDFIFSGTNGKKPLAGWTKGQRRMERALLAVSGERPVVRWTPHDLRRTVATRIAEKLGVGGEQLIKRVLGHSDGSVTAIYNRYGYVREMRSVLERWALDLTRDTSTSLQPDEANMAEAHPENMVA